MVFSFYLDAKIQYFYLSLHVIKGKSSHETHKMGIHRLW